MGNKKWPQTTPFPIYKSEDQSNRENDDECSDAMISMQKCSKKGARQSDEKIRASILKQTPLGCSSDQVSAFIKEKHWSVNSESRDKEFVMHRPVQNETHSVEDGSSFLACELGATHFVMFPF